MSGVKITSIDPMEDFEWVFENRRRSLSKQFHRDITRIKKLVNSYGFEETFRQEIDNLENEARDYYDSLTVDMDSFTDIEDLEDYVDSLIDGMNQQVSSIQFKVEQYNIEIQAETQQKKRQINDMIVHFEGDDVLPGYKNEVSEIKSRLETVNKDNPLERLNRIRTIDESLTTLLRQHDLAVTIDLSDTTEHHFTHKIIKQGDAADCKTILVDIVHYFELLHELDPDLASRFTSLIEEANSLPDGQRIRLIRDSLVLSYGKLKESLAWSNVYKNMLDEMISRLNGKSDDSGIIQKLIALKSEKIVDRAVFAQVRLEYLKTMQKDTENSERINYRETVVRELSSQLFKMGYSVSYNDMNLDSIVQYLFSGREVYCDTKWEGYKIVVKMNALGEIVTRVVKVMKKPDIDKIKSASKVSTEQDIIVSKGWHESYDILIDHLKKSGFCVKTEIEKMPDEVPLEFISADIFGKNTRKLITRKIDNSGSGMKNGLNA